MKPLFESRLGARLRRDDGYDTDSLGTFTRDVARTLGQRETATHKAVIAIERGGLRRADPGGTRGDTRLPEMRLPNCPAGVPAPARRPGAL